MQRSSDCNDNQPPGIPCQANAQAWQSLQWHNSKVRQEAGLAADRFCWWLPVYGLPIVPPIDYSAPM